MYYLRDKVSHEYFGIDYEVIWEVITNYLSDNKFQIDQILEAEKKLKFASSLFQGICFSIYKIFWL